MIRNGLLAALTALLLLAPPLSTVALAFGPVEYLWLSVFGLSLIASLSTGNVLKGLAGGAFGLLLSCVGVAEISADIRLTFGSSTMIGGIEVVGGLWILLVSLAGLRSRQLPVWLNRIGVATGVAGIATTSLLAAEVTENLFGLGCIVWFIWIGVHLVRGARAQQSSVR